MFLITLEEICLFDFFASFLVVSPINFISNLDYSSDLAIFIITSVSSFETINTVAPDPQMFFRTAASIADIVAVHPSSIKALLSNVVSRFFFNGKSAVSNGLIAL